MASHPGLLLADRTDVHRSCKSLETLLSVLNDYCEAAGAVVISQKKLVKALRETAGLKVTGEIPANAMNASANIFEALSEIDTKFAKILDKEYDGVSGEVRKWFKKLMKEEKAHDERINNANARIKQAGQLYEKKSKKSARDAAEEHTKYINLITTLGPEISQEKHNHTLQVTQRHTVTTYNVAACLSRMADAEWVRSCEGVRRFSPTVGQLSEWRALCEGGWTGPIPQDLPDLDDSQQGQGEPNTDTNRDGDERLGTLNRKDSREIANNSVEGLSPTGYTNERERAYHSSSVSPASSQHHVAGQNPAPTSTGPTEHNATARLDPAITSFESEMNSGSIRSLSAFPTPPTHFPLPPVSIPSSSQGSLPQSHSSQSWTSSSAPPTGPSVLPRLVESPKQADDDLIAADPPRPINEKKIDDHLPGTSSSETPEQGGGRTPRNSPETEQRSPQRTNTDPNYRHNQVFPGSAPGIPKASETWRKGDYTVDDREFGLDKAGQSKSNSVDAAKSKGVERRDTSGSLVTAMRNRYSHTSGATSPPPKDVPRLPLSVTDLASRYQPTDSSSPPQRRAASPTDVQPVPFPHVNLGEKETSFQDRSPGGYKPGPTTEDADIVRRRRQRIEELAELELKEKELELRAREREVELRARELERDRVHLMTTTRRDGGDLASRSQRPGPGRYSYSTTHLVPPLDPQSSSYRGQSSRSQESSPVRPQPQANLNEHAPYCGCDQCSIVKYKMRNTAPSPHDLRPPEKPIDLRPEKAKGSWMRRLSMPVMVGNAFSLDSKKNTSSTALKNVNLGGTVVMEDGRLVRRSYESSGGRR